MGAKFGHEVSPETRAKISAKLKGRPIPPDVLARRVASQRGHVVSEETRAKISASRMGHSVSPEARRKMSAANKGRVPSAETRAKLSEVMRRRHADGGVRHPEGPESANWKGDRVGYDVLHERVRRRLANQPCSLADASCKGRLEVSFKRHSTPPERWVFTESTWLGRPHRYPYSYSIEDYWRLCRSHHIRYDRGLLNLL